MAWKRKKKISQELTVNEILELYRKSIRKGPGRRYRIPFRYDKDDPRKSNMFCL